MIQLNQVIYVDIAVPARTGATFMVDLPSTSKIVFAEREGVSLRLHVATTTAGTQKYQFFMTRIGNINPDSQNPCEFVCVVSGRTETADLSYLFRVL